MAVDRLSARLETYLDSALDNLTAPVARAFVAGGANVAYDDCCEGQLWVRVTGITPVYPGNTPPAACGPVYYNAALAMGIVRCAATVNDQGIAPSPQVLTDEARAMNQDMTDLMVAILSAEDTPQRAIIGSWTPDGPQGGCAGGEWAFTIKFDPSN